MFARVPLEKIIDNPFQTRAIYGDVGELAMSIFKMKSARPETGGLIQVPPARIVLDGRVLDPEEYGGVIPCLLDEPEAWVELAAGHRRVRAFRYLFNVHGDDYATFPVDVQVLDDQAMADIAWEENAKRKDLTAIEEAEALLQRAIETFGWTQAEVGARWGLSQGAVANKLRLLKLPAEAQAAIRSGVITERHGRVLLQAMRTERIYQRVAEDIIPVKAEPTAVEKARQLVTDRSRFWNWRYDHYDDSIGDALRKARCEACGGPAVSPTGGVATTTGKEDHERHYLCPACFQAATDWSPCSVSEAEDLLRRVVKKETQLLAAAKFPLDVQVGEGIEEVRQGTCDGCPARETKDGEDLCLDKACYEAKTEAWYSHLVIQLRERLWRDFGNDAPVVNSYGGYDLQAIDDDDVALVNSGICAPGRCKRLRFRYISYEPIPPYYIQPYPDLPFVYNCSNSSSHAACQRRLRKSRRTDDEVEAEKQAKRDAERRRKAARAIADRAVQSYTRALRAGHEGAWRELATRLGVKVTNGLTADAYARAIVEQWWLGNGDVLKRNWSFSDDADVESVEAYMQEWLARAGVAMLPSTDDLIRKLERINHFVLDDEGLPRTDLTSEQVQGNLDNLTKIAVEAAEMCQDGRMSEHDFERMMGWVEELRTLLGAPADEVFPGK